MCERAEFEKRLDALPPNPYKPTADLREMHRLYHEAAKVNNTVQQFTALSAREDLYVLVERIKEPTEFGKALLLFDEVNRFAEDHMFDEGTSAIYKILQYVYSSHNPPSRIDHPY